MDDGLIPYGDGFAIDSSGKLHVVPMKMMKDMLTNAGNSSKKRESVRRNCLPIRPLNLAQFETQFEDCSNVKRRKIEPVRKELFKGPPKKTERRPSTSRLSVSKPLQRHSEIINKKLVFSNQKKIFKVSDSPLIDLEDTEAKLTNKKLLQAPLVLFPMTSIEEENEEITKIEKLEHTPTSRNSSQESVAEFLQIEEALASVKKKKTTSRMASPVSSVCSLLNNTRLSSGKKSPKDVTTALDQIASIMKKDEEQFELFKQQFELYQCQRQANVNRILDLVKSINDNKENKIRKSDRIAARDNANSVSPTVLKDVDLRKKTLNKNLAKNLQSPRTKRAVDMYNSIRSDCNILRTPKLDRSDMDFLKNGVPGSLSRKVQKQCLLLQDTPRQE